MTLPWKPKSKGYREQEARTAKKPGARAQVNSGRTWFAKGDVIEYLVNLGNVLTDNKDASKSKSYRITEKQWTELQRDANRTPPGCYPSLQIDLGRHKLRVIEEDLWDEIGRFLCDLDG